ncbi:MAG: hypothetical protein HFG15_00415 [Bacilli bacterium]|jgi:RNA-binding protein YlmH|nr:hypothetical protein [Bacilli bacterium]
MESVSIKIEHYIECINQKGATPFLEGQMIDQVASALEKRGISYQVYELFEGCEKKIFYTDLIPDLVCYQIKSARPLRHQEILGSLFAHQIESNVFGDIVIFNEQSYITFLGHMRSYCLAHITMIGTTPVALIEVPLTLLAGYQYQYVTNFYIVPSVRLDNVVAKIMNTGRGQAQAKLKAGDIRMNYEVVTKASSTLQRGDILSIRRVGKFRYQGIIKMTKKDHYQIQIDQFI